jgi:phosphate transport system permease protein
MAGLRQYLRRGDPAVWFTGAGLGISLLMIAGMIGIILVNGLGYFWPSRLEQITLNDGTTLLGEIVTRQTIPTPGQAGVRERHRLQLKLGNRDITGVDFRWVDEDQIRSRQQLPHALYVERREYGPFIGFAKSVSRGDEVIAEGPVAAWAALQPLITQAEHDRAELRTLERDEVGGINYQIEQQRLALRRLQARAAAQGAASVESERRAVEQRIEELHAVYTKLEEQLVARRAAASDTRVTLASAAGEEMELPTLDIFRAYEANQLSTMGRARVYGGRVWEFIAGEPRESNTEGGIFPAIFGTVMMVLLMSVLAVPFGVVAALYLREYARQGVLVRMVRIAVNNLAGVPSIVFGVFGLGFFVYFVGGSIDRIFFPELLPTPTFGTGGILWASLTLGLLTVPVVIVAAEEALAAVPRSMREASLATGATKFQTILRVVLPAAAPGILTGLILAMARGAGEVAPLMITGVVKLAPDLPLDGFFPYLHLDRKFMHLGFHIYDVGFQSPNVEAAKPMVYATSILLLAIVVLLNMTAIVVRNRLRRRYQTSAF